RMRRDISRFSRWSAEEIRWLRGFGRGGLPELDKFNAGQKLNAVFVGGAIVVMLGTGSVMRWFTPFPDSWRTGATFVHDVLATAIFVVVIGHIAFALSHREALGSMVTGRISRRWAVRHAPLWLEEVDGPAERPRPQMPRGRRDGSQSRRVTAARKA
ncbi:MAG TPA: cytochrome b/b6 domain-containing protein, partial [Acidimicrobiales bacterium]|nr:cytochrome b/b6 domain-containing protein [Acidimicrobiales bacterium]